VIGKDVSLNSMTVVKVSQEHMQSTICKVCQVWSWTHSTCFTCSQTFAYAVIYLSVSFLFPV